MATFRGIPVSTTHTITGAIAGVGATRPRNVRWGVACGIAWAWVLTIPCTALIAAGIDKSGGSMPPTWVIVACYMAMGLGTLLGGWRIVKTMGQRITKLNQASGFCANSGGAITLFMATFLGIPVSTTHTITGAIAGVGATRPRNVRWGVAGGIAWAWVLTIPCTALIAAVAWAIGQALF